MSKLTGGATADTGAVQKALAGILGKGDAPDIAGLLAAFQSGGLESAVKSWLGNGENEPISKEQIKGAVDGEKLTQLASALGTDEDTALSGLKDAVPEMVDKASPDGSLLDSIGGLAGAAKLVKGLMG